MKKGYKIVILIAAFFVFIGVFTTKFSRAVFAADTAISITKSGGYNEGAFVEFAKVSGCTLADYEVSYQKEGTSSYTTIDSDLIREGANTIRADIVGLSAGTYQVKVKAKTVEAVQSNLTVSAYDRSGYAHFGTTTGVGAYNNDGTLKSNAIVVYVTNETKNTVTTTIAGKTYTGLVAILQAQSKSSVPLNIRLIGKISTNQWKYKCDEPRLTDDTNQQLDTFWKNEFETTYGDNLAGLTVKYMDKVKGKSYTYKTKATGLGTPSEGSSSVKTCTYKGTDFPNLTGKTVYDDDSYFNMLDVTKAKNVTVEDIGTDAQIFQWGFTWGSCSSIEVRNITFVDNPEDACSFEGDDKNPTQYGRYWVHHNVFNRGKNNWDVSGERDKYAGDGSTDFKGIYGITSSYNVFNNCKKTGLVGGSNSVLTKDVTFHHNYYNQVGSRLPLGRQANMHFYNNYYYKCSTCQDIRANAFVLSESNYFEQCGNAQLVTRDSTYKGTIIKSYNDVFNNCTTTQSTKVTSRTEAISGGVCKPDGSSDYNNFDTDASLFYYDTTNQCSEVTVLNKAEEVPTIVPKVAGVLTGDFTAIDPTTPDVPDKPVEPDVPDQPVVPISSTVVIHFNSLAKGSYTSNQTIENATILATSSKTVSISEANTTIAGVSITKYLSLGGSGAMEYRNVQFSTAQKADITVYFNGGLNKDGSGRTLALKDSQTTIGTTIPTDNGSTPLSHKFTDVNAGTYHLMSTGSGINVYAIVIEYKGLQATIDQSMVSTMDFNGSKSLRIVTKLSNVSDLNAIVNATYSIKVYDASGAEQFVKTKVITKAYTVVQGIQENAVDKEYYVVYILTGIDGQSGVLDGMTFKITCTLLLDNNETVTSNEYQFKLSLN